MTEARLRFSYFPGCLPSGSTREYDLATRAVARALDIELLELADWNCCGGLSADSLSERARLTLCQRNLQQVPPEAPELLCPCPHCYSNFSRTLAACGEPAEAIGVTVRSLLDAFGSEEVLTRLAEKRVEPLTDLKMVAYLGCKLARPAGRTWEPGALERVIEACGAKPVEWSAWGECCGAALGVARPEVAEELLGRIFQAALAAEAEAIVVACPLCHLNLDLHQYRVSQRLGRRVDLPVFSISELMALALGIEECDDWLERHVTSPLSLFMRFLEAQEEREYWGEEGSPPEGEEKKVEEGVTSVAPPLLTVPPKSPQLRSFRLPGATAKTGGPAEEVSS